MNKYGKFKSLKFKLNKVAWQQEGSVIFTLASVESRISWSNLINASF